MLELLKTDNITQENMLEAVRRINETILRDHKSMKTLQRELADRDEKLLNEISGVKKELQGTNQRLESLEKSTNKRLESLEIGQNKMIDLLGMIAENTKSKS